MNRKKKRGRPENRDRLTTDSLMLIGGLRSGCERLFFQH